MGTSTSSEKPLMEQLARSCGLRGRPGRCRSNGSVQNGRVQELSAPECFAFDGGELREVSDVVSTSMGRFSEPGDDVVGNDSSSVTKAFFRRMGLSESFVSS